MASVDVRDTVEILLDCNEKGEKLSRKFPASIYMVPSILRDLSPSSFEPRVVSIGPLHREDKILKDFDEQKTLYLFRLLNRLVPSGSSPRQTLNKCLHRVETLITEIRNCYVGMNPYSDAELAKMMVMDACFILEFLFPSEESENLIRGNITLTSSIYQDLVLLENQIPFVVLQEIFDCTLSTLFKVILTSAVLEKLKFLLPFSVIRYDGFDTKPNHILGLLQKSFHQSSHPTNVLTPQEFRKPSAVELDMAGVKFKGNEYGNEQIAIEHMSCWFPCFCRFWGHPTLTMPVMRIYDNTEQFLRNAIAYEQCTPDVPNCLTSYACALDFLVDDTKDVIKLVESKVIINNLGSNEDAANMLNSIAKQVVLTQFYYIKQWEQLDTYMNAYWPKRIAQLRRTYFSSPWSFIALIAGIVLFALTIVQTIFTIKAAYK
ncbi:hypothetical protein OSB04_021309 [Centaurea solstitialis]|uniref:Uncharacterized protein n=1 Tax=Centaurea solstitialis TaxID=347529 RepID=A0AA38WHN2_9ASTR|nr:hypothetical protein OSB04_021309 [Centaurea solstitialis]